jgi:hypothetical protein
MSARLISSRTNPLRVNGMRRQNARLLELLYLACALLLGVLLAATTLAAPLRRPHIDCRVERGGINQAVSPILHVAPRTAAAQSDSQ